MKLRYRDDGTFKIMQFTDTHIGNRPYNEADKKTFALVEYALKHYEVDLIMHTGDIIWSDGVTGPDEIFKEFMESFNAVETPKAITFGNHDAEGTATRTDLREIFNQRVTNKAGLTNLFSIETRESYTLEIYKHNSEEVENVLYVMDSGGEASLPIGIYEWNHPDQVEWFKDVSKKYRKGDNVKRNLVFQHIPIPEYWQAANNIIAGENNETDERISAPHINTGLFANMLIDGETWGIFVGHDHENNFDSLLHGIHLVYGNVSGYNTYGDTNRGVRMIELNANNHEIKTYTIELNDFTQ
jgi:3',5'-cyclic AMP phosphodiesterase CpdA